MGPVIAALRDAPWADLKVLATDQHDDLLDQALGDLDLKADRRLGCFRAGQSLAGLTARLVTALDGVFADDAPDFFLAQGDTTSVLAGALVAFYHRVPFGHVEAGLRTGKRDSPFPEEMNRVLVGRLATQHFAPTPAARANLLAEGVPAATVHCVGNPVVDSLQRLLKRREALGLSLKLPVGAGRRLLVVTAHRRESFGAPLKRICEAIRELIDARDDVEVLWPLHPNPNVGTVVRAELGELERVHLRPAMPYGEFVAAMRQADVLLSDSGGVQEEATVLGKPLLVLRQATERPEALESVGRLVGTDPAAIVAEVSRLLREDGSREQRRSPFGDGRAGARIAALVGVALGVPGIQPLAEFVPPEERTPG